MNNVIVYRDYSAIVEYSANDRLLWGRLAGIRDIVSFHGETPEQLEAAFHEAVDDYLEGCAEIGREPQATKLDAVAFDLPVDLRVRAAERAHAAGQSVGEWAVRALDRASRAA